MWVNGALLAHPKSHILAALATGDFLNGKHRSEAVNKPRLSWVVTRLTAHFRTMPLVK